MRQLQFPKRRELLVTDRLALILFPVLFTISAFYAFGGLQFSVPTTEVFASLVHGAFWICAAIVFLGRAVRFVIRG